MKALLVAFIAFLPATPAAARPWVRGFVVDSYEPAFFYGGKAGTEERGSDCPKGTMADNDYKTMLKTPWRSPEELAEIAAPASAEIDNRPVLKQLLAHRGFRKEVDTYINPFAAPDPGFQQVTGRISEGFDLDGNARTGGFTNPAGQKGIDNNYYRVFGCNMSFRGAAHQAYQSQVANIHMRDGLYTFVIRISGNQDPMNDNDAKLEVAYSPDRAARDAAGHTIADYSFRIVKRARYSLVKARIRNGVVETAATELAMPDFAYSEAGRGEAVFHKGRLRLTMRPDGSLQGLVGGYRDWVRLYEFDTWNQPFWTGQTRETYYHTNQIGFYYALKRNADGMMDPKTGQNTAISTAYRIVAQPAYVVDAVYPAGINEPPVPFDAIITRAISTEAIATKSIAGIPRRSRARDEDEEDAIPAIEDRVASAERPGATAQLESDEPDLGSAW